MPLMELLVQLDNLLLELLDPPCVTMASRVSTTQLVVVQVPLDLQEEALVALSLVRSQLLKLSLMNSPPSSSR